MNNAKLFTSPRGTNKETECAAQREKAFQLEYGQLQSEWYGRLVANGMNPDHVYDNHGRRDTASVYDEAQEYYYSQVARFEHVGTDEDFQTGHQDNIELNKRVWHLHAVGQTERDIAETLDMSRNNVARKLDVLTKRFKRAAEDGRLKATVDSKADVATANRLHAIGRKYLDKLARKESLGELIVDRFIDSGALVPRKLDNDSIEALNRVTATLALVMGAK